MEKIKPRGPKTRCGFSPAFRARLRRIAQFVGREALEMGLIERIATIEMGFDGG